MRLNGIAGIQYRRYAALRVIRAALVQFTLGKRDDAGGVGQSQCQTEAGGAAADNQDVGKNG